jgi:hypothetical protein
MDFFTPYWFVVATTSTLLLVAPIIHRVLPTIVQRWLPQETRSSNAWRGAIVKFTAIFMCAIAIVESLLLFVLRGCFTLM